jgi:CheY-like chemotaxis protein
MARILVVDDSPTEPHHMVNALARQGHQVLTAATARMVSTWQVTNYLMSFLWMS